MVVKTRTQSEVRVEVSKPSEYSTFIKLYQAHAQFDDEPITENNIIMWSKKEWEELKAIVDEELSQG